MIPELMTVDRYLASILVDSKVIFEWNFLKKSIDNNLHLINRMAGKLQILSGICTKKCDGSKWTRLRSLLIWNPLLANALEAYTINVENLSQVKHLTSEQSVVLLTH